MSNDLTEGTVAVVVVVSAVGVDDRERAARAEAAVTRAVRNESFRLATDLMPHPDRMTLTDGRYPVRVHEIAELNCSLRAGAVKVAFQPVRLEPLRKDDE